MKRIAIIGGGASGLAAAASALEAARACGREVSVRIFEATDRIGRPVLATGNGRCNFTNARIDAAAYRNPAFAGEALDAFERTFPKEGHPNGVAAFFARRGMLYREEGEGRLYPLANKASVVLDVLRHASVDAGAEACTGSRVEFVDVPAPGRAHFTMRMADGAFERADAVVVACGGKVAQGLLPPSLARIPSHPVLCSLATDATYVRELDNIRAKATLRLLREGGVLAEEAGEVMFRKYGMSGICAFNLSRLAVPGDELSVDFLPFVAAGDVRAFAEARLAGLCQVEEGAPDCAGFLRGMVLPRVADVVLRRCALPGERMVDAESAALLAGALKDFRAEVEGVGDAEHAQVTRGGFDVAGFDPETLESREVAGLHVVGEALDVDGPCGGYNLHWAFSTGMLAGKACAARA